MTSTRFPHGTEPTPRSRLMWRFAVYGLLLWLTACGITPLVKPNEPIKMGSFTVSSPIEWSQFGYNRLRIWTLDGTNLNQLAFLIDIKDREHVFLDTPSAYSRRGEGALFRAGISEAEAVELIADGITTLGMTTPKVEKVAPARFGELPGFRFELSFAAQRGLRYQAIGIGEIQDDTLSYVLFFAPAEYYFGRNRSDVEAVFESIRTLP